MFASVAILAQDANLAFWHEKYRTRPPSPAPLSLSVCNDAASAIPGSPPRPRRRGIAGARSGFASSRPCSCCSCNCWCLQSNGLLCVREGGGLQVLEDETLRAASATKVCKGLKVAILRADSFCKFTTKTRVADISIYVPVYTYLTLRFRLWVGGGLRC